MLDVRYDAYLVNIFAICLGLYYLYQRMRFDICCNKEMNE